MTTHPEPNPSGGDRAPIQDGDPAWVADLFDPLHESDVDASLADLEPPLRTTCDAPAARHVLAGLQPNMIGQGLEVRATRRGSEL